MSDLLTLGEALGSLRPDAMLTAGSRVPVSVAGAESNVAIAASRLGHEVTFVGSVGDDALGRLVERTLRGEGVRTVLHRSPRPTGVILFEEPVPGRTRVDYHRRESAGTRPCLSDLEAALAEAPRCLHLTGVTSALGDAAREAQRQAAALTLGQRTVLSLDVNYRARLWSRSQAQGCLRALIRDFPPDMLFASEDELDLCVGGVADDETARVHGLFDLGVGQVIVTRGAQGATAYGPEGCLHQGSVRVVALDPVGAGDAFVAGFLSGHLDGLALRERLVRAAEVAGFVVGTRGDWEGAPRRTELALLSTDDGTTLR